MICFPNAKINLGLSITEKRNDSMHNIETCYIPIPIFDILEVKQSNKFSIKQSGVPLLCNSDNNLIIKAWKELSTIKKDIKPVSIFLYKNIPIGSGLGGGSSNAAFFLKAINNLLSLRITSYELKQIATKIGADCSFFINNTSTIATGIGNTFSNISNPVNNMQLTVVFPEINISTKDAFEKIIPRKRNNLITVINGPKSKWRDILINDFEEITFSDFPVLQDIKNTLYELGAIYASLSGSGSAIYALSSEPLNTAIFSKKYSIWSKVLVLD